MPVGTTLHLNGEVAGDVQVARVHEGVGAGMLVRKAAVSHQPSAVSAEVEEAPEKEPEKENGGGAAKKEKRKKKR
jgi:hypothetical protein